MQLDQTLYVIYIIILAFHNLTSEVTPFLTPFYCAVYMTTVLDFNCARKGFWRKDQRQTPPTPPPYRMDYWRGAIVLPHPPLHIECDSVKKKSQMFHPRVVGICRVAKMSTYKKEYIYMYIVSKPNILHRR